MNNRADLVPKRILNSAGVETTVYVRRDQGHRLDGSPLLSLGAPTISSLNRAVNDEEVRIVKGHVAYGSKVTVTDNPDMSGFVTDVSMKSGKPEYEVTWGSHPFDEDSTSTWHSEGTLSPVALSGNDWSHVVDELRDRGISASSDTDGDIILEFQDGVQGVLTEDRSTIRFFGPDGEDVLGRSWNESPVSDGLEPSNAITYIGAIEEASRRVEIDLHNNPYTP